MNARRNVRGARLPLALLLAAAMLPCACRGLVAPTPKKKAAAKTYDDSYIAALAAANQFCSAWLSRDEAAGKALLSQRVRRTFSDTRIQGAIAGALNPTHSAFEIADGRRGDDDTYTFSLRLFYRYTGRDEQRIESPAERIVLRRDASGRWLVDRFPLLDEPTSQEVIRVGPAPPGRR